MLTSKVSCPHCAATLRAEGVDLTGRRVKCQKCGQKFVAGAGMVPVAAPYAAPQPTMELPAMTAITRRDGDTVQNGLGLTPPHGIAQRTGVYAAPTALAFAPPSPPPSHRSGVAVAVAVTVGTLLIAGGALGVYFVLNSGTTPDSTLQSQANPAPPPKDDSEANLQPLVPSGQPKETPAPEPKKGEEPQQPAPAVEPKKNVEPAPEPKKSDTPSPEPKRVDPPVRPPEPMDTGKKPETPEKNPIGGGIELPPLGKKGDGPKGGDGYHTVLSPEHQKKVNDAIEKGVKFLKRSQQPDGGWSTNKQYGVGYAALPALTLLECGVAGDDAGIQKAAAYVREKAPQLTGTYELSLAILFLDKLGDKRDQNLVRHLAARLIAGQQLNGGWTYNCPILNNKEEFDLVVYLHKTRPDPIIFGSGKDNEPQIPVGKDPNGKDLVPLPGTKGTDPVGGTKPNDPNQNSKPDEQKPGGVALPFPGDGSKTLPTDKPGDKDKPASNPPPKGPVDPVFKPFNTNTLTPAVQKLAIVKNFPLPKSMGRNQPLPKQGASDNSNTQFAIMALWVARKYNVPVEKTMALVDQRFLSSQNKDGGWSYIYLGGGSTPSMTCVGMIGLAVGHGSHKESLGADWKKVSAASIKDDPAIHGGLRALGTHVGQAPPNWDQKIAQGNLYLLWSIERVAMLYNLKTIGGKDWYSWAAQMLVVNQHDDGSWASNGHYHGQSPVINTCLSLLILRRANFVPDLTDSLKEYIPIRDN